MANNEQQTGASVEDLPRTIELTKDSKRVLLIDQRKLPEDLLFLELIMYEDVIDAIKTLAVRGAPAIGVAGAFALVLFSQNEYKTDKTKTEEENVKHYLYELSRVVKEVGNARPTAVNLEWAVQRVFDIACVCAQTGASVKDITNAVTHEARLIQEEDEAACRQIGKNGAALIKNDATILTHCNAGSLATSFYGTALGVIYSAHTQGKIKRVYADETRPVGQGARLSVWELTHAGVPTTLICDNMAASLMAKGEIDAVIVGADRIAKNGDVANKIGTYGVSVLAKHHNIPFYVAAPVSSIDASIETGNDIPIEQRSAKEITSYETEGLEIYNPAFDVTPANLVSAIITEEKVFYPPYLFGENA